MGGLGRVLGVALQLAATWPGFPQYRQSLLSKRRLRSSLVRGPRFFEPDPGLVALTSGSVVSPLISRMRGLRGGGRGFDCLGFP